VPFFSQIFSKFCWKSNPSKTHLYQKRNTFTCFLYLYIIRHWYQNDYIFACHTQLPIESYEHSFRECTKIMLSLLTYLKNLHLPPPPPSGLDHSVQNIDYPSFLFFGIVTLPFPIFWKTTSFLYSPLKSIKNVYRLSLAAKLCCPKRIYSALTECEPCAVLHNLFAVAVFMSRHGTRVSSEISCTKTGHHQVVVVLPRRYVNSLIKESCTVRYAPMGQLSGVILGHLFLSITGCYYI